MSHTLDQQRKRNEEWLEALRKKDAAFDRYLGSLKPWRFFLCPWTIWKRVDQYLDACKAEIGAFDKAMSGDRRSGFGGAT